MKRAEVNSGDRFSKLVIVSEVESSRKSGRKFEVLCDCGNTKQVLLGNLRTGHTKSCGCLSGQNITHGKTKTRVYKSWSGMKERCLVSTRPNFKDYGGRGIKVHEDWINSFENFYSYVGDPPDDGKWSIEREDVNGNYEPGNVKWALPDEQNRNRRKFSNNTSGTTGVIIRVDKGVTRYVATGYDLNGDSRSKSFSGGRYEDPEREAVAFRLAKIVELNSLGANYSENHGVQH